MLALREHVERRQMHLALASIVAKQHHQVAWAGESVDADGR